jgi:SAM-dependent methyltransferase
MIVEVCPGCGAADSEVLDSAGACGHSEGGEVFEQPPYSVVRCRRCGLYYKSDVADDKTLGRCYAVADFRRWESPTLYPTEQVAVQLLRQIPRGAKILDFGCSSGRLLAHLVGDYQCMGFEINADASAVARGKGIQMLADPMETGRQSLDAVIMVDVFEHLSQPTQILLDLASLLKPGGRLIISTGNADSPAFQEALAQFWYMRTLQHLVMFSRAYAQFLGDRLGAHLDAWHEVCHYRWRLVEQIRERTQRFAYRTFHCSPRPAWAPIAACIPWIRRARHWQSVPPFTCSRDHVVAAFRMPGTK